MTISPSNSKEADDLEIKWEREKQEAWRIFVLRAAHWFSLVEPADKKRVYNELACSATGRIIAMETANYVKRALEGAVILRKNVPELREIMSLAEDLDFDLVDSTLRTLVKAGCKKSK